MKVSWNYSTYKMEELDGYVGLDREKMSIDYNLHFGKLKKLVKGLRL